MNYDTDKKYRWFDGLVWVQGPPVSKEPRDNREGWDLRTDRPCIVYADRAYHIVGNSNMLGGVCDCCVDAPLRESVKWHAYLDVPTNTEPPRADPTPE